jgi:hypothetical protein
MGKGKFLSVLIYLLAMVVLPGGVYSGISVMASKKTELGLPNFSKIMVAEPGKYGKIEVRNPQTKRSIGSHYDIAYFCTFFSFLSVILAWFMLYKFIDPGPYKRWWYFTAILVAIANLALPYIWNYYHSQYYTLNGKDIMGYVQPSSIYLFKYAIILFFISSIVFLILSIPKITGNLGGNNTRNLSPFIKDN